MFFCGNVLYINQLLTVDRDVQPNEFIRRYGLRPVPSGGQGLKVGVVCDHVICIRCDRAIRELVIVEVGCNHSKSISRVHFNKKATDGFGKREDFTELIPAMNAAV